MGLVCEGVAMLVEEGKIDSANYPGLYPRNTKCHWLIGTPAEDVIKLEFQDFAVEVNLGIFRDDAALYPIKSGGSIVMGTFTSRSEAAMKGFLLTSSDEHTLSANLCGQKTPFSLFSSSSFLTLFKTDEPGYSGWSLVCVIDGHGKLVGIASWDCHTCHPEPVDTRISAYRHGVSSVTNQNV
ncbi:LOW QUALITY PROTEIN: ovochymase-1 [Phaethornis superciliosus]